LFKLAHLKSEMQVGGDLLLTHAQVNEARANRTPNPFQRLELGSQKESERSD
jgi:hypothetical protein